METAHGLFGILLGALLLILPAAGIMTMTEFTGILTGVLLLVFGINVIVGDLCIS